MSMRSAPVILDLLWRLRWEKPKAITWITAQHPFRGTGETKDIAQAALFLASEDAGWITGIGLPVDGGFLTQ